VRTVVRSPIFSVHRLHFQRVFFSFPWLDSVAGSVGDKCWQVDSRCSWELGIESSLEIDSCFRRAFLSLGFVFSVGESLSVSVFFELVRCPLAFDVGCVVRDSGGLL
jgi:hypothetical protein